MKSFYYSTIKKSDFEKKVKKGNNYIASILIKDIDDGYSLIASCGYGYDVGESEVESDYKEFLNHVHELQLAEAIRSKISEITEYDTSDNVNVFYINGIKTWLDKATRVGLVNSTNAMKSAGYARVTFWLDSIPISIPCKDAIGILESLERYALECFNVTATHKAQVSAFTNVDDVNRFDITNGYPDVLSFTV